MHGPLGTLGNEEIPMLETTSRRRAWGEDLRERRGGLNYPCFHKVRQGVTSKQHLLWLSRPLLSFSHLNRLLYSRGRCSALPVAHLIDKLVDHYRKQIWEEVEGGKQKIHNICRSSSASTHSQ